MEIYCNNASFVFLLIVLFCLFHLENAYKFGVLSAESNSGNEDFCVYLSATYYLPDQRANAESLSLQYDNETDWCNSQEVLEADSENRIIILPVGNCSISTQVHNIVDRGGKAIFFIKEGSSDNFDFAERLPGIEVATGKISENSVKKLREMGNAVKVSVFRPKELHYSYFFAVIWVLAMFTVIVGSYSSGQVSYDIYSRELRAKPVGAKPQNQPRVQIIMYNDMPLPTLILTPSTLIMFCIMSSAILVLVYIYVGYLVLFYVYLFTLMSIFSLLYCLNKLKSKFTVNFYSFRCYISYFETHVPFDICDILIFVISISLPIWWVACREYKNAWILQDVFAIATCILVLNHLRLSSMKICLGLLLFVFFLDIFFVLVTPYFTAKGISIMEDVATAGKKVELRSQSVREEVGSGRRFIEMMPMLIKVQDIGFSSLCVCNPQHMILGLGDIVLPGFLLSYLYAFDLMTNKRNIYFFLSVIAYGLGLIFVTVGLIYSASGQPALMYIVPAILIPPILLSWYRGELNALWTGFHIYSGPIICGIEMCTLNGSQKTKMS